MKLTRRRLPPLLAVAAAAPASVKAAPAPLPGLREQAALQQSWLRERLDTHLPALMRRNGVAMWLVICREYNEDPVFSSLVSASTFAARRRTIYVFFDRGEDKGVERLALGGGSQGGVYQVYRDPDTGVELWGDGQWMLLRRLIDDRKPASIAVNISHTHAFADGLSAGEREQLEKALGPEHLRRVVRAESLAVDFVSLRLPQMRPTYEAMMQNVHEILAQAFSSRVVQPGRTTDQDLIWWLREETRRRGFGTWFQPNIRVQRATGLPPNLLAEEQPVKIERGDVLWSDYGITCMRLNTDTQHVGYVLKKGEKAAPAGIQQALSNSQRMQDIVMARMRPGVSGNLVLKEARQAVRDSGINGTVYSHPIGDHGHGAGPLIGLWDRQEGVPGRGDSLLLPGTWYSIELASRTKVAEWGERELWIGMEEDAFLMEDGKMRWVLDRQQNFYYID
jgi:Xaa-Pro aminopeptidase